MQTLITNTNFGEFNRMVNERLQQGWKVVPTTLKVVSNDSTYSGMFAVVLEKD